MDNENTLENTETNQDSSILVNGDTQNTTPVENGGSQVENQTPEDLVVNPSQTPQDAWEEDEVFTPDDTNTEKEPVETGPGVVESLETTKAKLTFNKEGIYVGENLDLLHKFVKQEEVDKSIKAVNTRIDNLPNKDNTYTKLETDAFLNEKADIESVYSKDETFTKFEVQNKLAVKLNLSEAYNKVDIDRGYLKIKDLPININPKAVSPNITDFNAASLSPFSQDAFSFTQEQYDALSNEEKLNNKLYIIVDGTTEELLGSTKPQLVANQVKAVKSGQTLELTFNLVPQTTLEGECTEGSIRIEGNKAYYKSPLVSITKTTFLTFRGVRNNLKSQALEIPIVIANIPENNKIVSFDGNGEASGSMNQETIILEDGKFTYELPNCLYKPQYNLEFKGWSTSTEDETKYLGTTGDIVEFTDNSPITLYAIWQNKTNKNVTIHYHANGGSGEMETQVINIGKFTIPQCNFAPPARKVFALWSENKLGTFGQVMPGEEVSFPFSREVHLYAIWRGYEEDLLRQPGIPTPKTGYPETLTEGETGLIEFTNIVGNLIITDKSNYKNNSAEVFGNTIKVTALYGSVTMRLVIYQTSQYGVKSDECIIEIRVNEANPKKLELVDNQVLTGLVSERVNINFKNAEYKLSVVDKTSSTSAEIGEDDIQINGDSISVISNTEQTITLQVIQVKITRENKILNSDILEIPVTFVSSLDTGSETEELPSEGTPEDGNS